MRVSKGRGRPTQNQADSKRLRNDPVELRHGIFLEALHSAQNEKDSEVLTDLMETIDTAAKAFAESPTFANLRHYKRLVQQFLGGLLKGAYHVNEQTGFDRYGTHKMYRSIRLVDKHLQDLTQDVLNKHRPILNLVERLDEIRGLLCDLYR